MKTTHTSLALALALATLPLAGCQGPSSSNNQSRNNGGEEILRPTDDPALAPYRTRFSRVEQMLTRWDALRNDGRAVEAGDVARRIQGEVDSAFADFARGVRGELGLHAQYLSMSALGFSANPQATQLLVEEVRSGKDSKLVGNALIALSVRADPRTQGPILLARMGQDQGVSVRRYAPLALANVLDARRAAGLPVDPLFESQAISRLSPLAVDQDPATRLHVAKAMGVIKNPASIETLTILTRDPKMRVRWAAAAGLERKGDPRGFPAVVRLLHEVAPESKHVIRDLLVSYAAKLEGRPLTPDEIQRLGTGARAWSGWFNEYQRSTGANKPTTPAFPAPARK